MTRILLIFLVFPAGLYAKPLLLGPVIGASFPIIDFKNTDLIYEGLLRSSIGPFFQYEWLGGNLNFITIDDENVEVAPSEGYSLYLRFFTDIYGAEFSTEKTKGFKIIGSNVGYNRADNLSTQSYAFNLYYGFNEKYSLSRALSIAKGITGTGLFARASFSARTLQDPGGIIPSAKRAAEGLEINASRVKTMLGSLFIGYSAVYDKNKGFFIGGDIMVGPNVQFNNITNLDSSSYDYNKIAWGTSLHMKLGVRFWSWVIAISGFYDQYEIFIDDTNSYLSKFSSTYLNIGYWFN